MTDRVKRSRILQRLTLVGALLSWPLTGIAADSPGTVPSIQGPEIMVYFRQPLGAGTSWAPRVYGLRIAQTSATTTLNGTAVIAGVGRRELVDLQMGLHSSLRIDFARRVSWDFGRRQFNASNYSADMALKFSNHSLAADRAPSSSFKLP